MIERREIAIAIVLSIVTCGLYGIYWFIKLNDEINQLVGDTTAPSGGMAFLFSIITCGIYSYFWMYKMGNNIDTINARNGSVSQYSGILYLVLAFFGLAIISYALMQDSINKAIASR